MEPTSTPGAVEQSTPTPQVDTAQAPQAVESTPSQPSTPQAQARQELYQRYYQQSSPQAEAPATESVDTTPQTTPVVEDGAGEVPTSAQDAQPAPTTQELLAEIYRLQSLIQTQQPQAPVPPPAPAVEASPEVTIAQKFVALMQQGKPDEAIQALQSGIAEAVSPDVTNAAAQRAVEQIRAGNEIEKFVTSLRETNPDLVPLEEFISHKAQAYLNNAQQQAKQAWSSSDFVANYKAAVNAAVKDTRAMYQQIRGAGKQEAMTVKTQVLSSTPLVPNSVTQNRPDTPPPAPAPETTQSYLQKRQAMQLQRRGMQ